MARALAGQPRVRKWFQTDFRFDFGSTSLRKIEGLLDPYFALLKYDTIMVLA
jgi:hypothetical protein